MTEKKEPASLTTNVSVVIVSVVMAATGTWMAVSAGEGSALWTFGLTFTSAALFAGIRAALLLAGQLKERRSREPAGRS